MRQMSSKRATVQRERVRRLRAAGADLERCQWPQGCVSRATDGHESLSRARGGDPLDPDWLLCRVHHDLITSAHGELLAWAVEVGLIRSAQPGELSHAVQPVSYTPSMAKSPQLAVRIPQAADDWISRLATSLGATRTVVVRAMLREATEHPEAVQRRIKAYLAGTL